MFSFVQSQQVSFRHLITSRLQSHSSLHQPSAPLHKRHLWVVPSGQGKSRIYHWFVLLQLQLKPDSEVIFVYDSAHDMNRDRSEFSFLFGNIANKVKYLVGISNLNKEINGQTNGDVAMTTKRLPMTCQSPHHL